MRIAGETDRLKKDPEAITAQLAAVLTNFHKIQIEGCKDWENLESKKIFYVRTR